MIPEWQKRPPGFPRGKRRGQGIQSRTAPIELAHDLRSRFGDQVSPLVFPRGKRATPANCSLGANSRSTHVAGRNFELALSRQTGAQLYRPSWQERKTIVKSPSYRTFPTKQNSRTKVGLVFRAENRLQIEGFR